MRELDTQGVLPEYEVVWRVSFALAVALFIFKKIFQILKIFFSQNINARLLKLYSGNTACLPGWKHDKDLTEVTGTGAAPDGDEDAISGMIMAVKVCIICWHDFMITCFK